MVLWSPHPSQRREQSYSIKQPPSRRLHLEARSAPKAQACHDWMDFLQHEGSTARFRQWTKSQSGVARAATLLHGTASCYVREPRAKEAKSAQHNTAVKNDNFVRQGVRHGSFAVTPLAAWGSTACGSSAGHGRGLLLSVIGAEPSFKFKWPSGHVSPARLEHCWSTTNQLIHTSHPNTGAQPAHAHQSTKYKGSSSICWPILDCKWKTTVLPTGGCWLHAVHACHAHACTLCSVTSSKHACWQG